MKLDSNCKHCHDSNYNKTHSHTHGEGVDPRNLAVIVVGAIIFLAAIILKTVSANIFLWKASVGTFLYLLAYLIIGTPVLLRALKNIRYIRYGQFFDENFLMSIATIGAIVIGQYAEAVSVMLFYQVGEMFQNLALNRSRKSISALMNIRPDYAVIKTDEGEVRVEPGEVKPGQLIVVRPGERIPLDGFIAQGVSVLDVSALTGESLPKKVAEGDEVYSGSVNKEGLLIMEVSKPYAESTVSRILELVESAGDRKAPTEKFITKFAGYYTPLVVFSAVAIATLPPLAIKAALFSDWFRRALIFLVIACPCALVISIPLGFFGGIGAASKRGILVKGGNFLEALNSLDTVVFDKTGTLTKGNFKVTKIESAGQFSKDEILKLAAYGESYSNHPIAKSITEAYGKEIDKSKIGGYEEISGHGIKAIVEDKRIMLGNRKLMAGAAEFERVHAAESAEGGVAKFEIPSTMVYIAIDEVYAGYIAIADEIKEDSKKTIEELKKLGVRKTVMLTGDNKEEGRRVAVELGLDHVYSELLPHEKVEKIEELEKEIKGKGKLLFAGDGINDAPVLARAHVGVAMGALGSDAAIEAADIVLMTDEPSKIIDAVSIAKRTRKIIWQNIILAMAVKLAVLALGAFGLASMWEAVFADVGVALLAILNAMRVKTPATDIGIRNDMA